jgi:hypothetical protein
VRTLLAAFALLVSSTTAAGPVLDTAATELQKDPVYVSPDAEKPISGSQADDLRRTIKDGSQALYIAVLPTAAEGEASGGLNGLPEALYNAVGLQGTYAVVTGNGFRAASNALPSGVAASLATNAFNDHKSEGAAGVLQAFAKEVESYDPATGKTSGGSSGGGGGGGIGVGTILLILGAAALGIFLLRNSSKRRKQELSVLHGDQEDLRASLSVLADDVMRLEPEVGLHPEARDDYEAGVARYKWALAAVDAIDSPDDVPRVRRGMAEAQYAMARARAIIQGNEPPAPPPELQQPGQYGEPPVVLDDEKKPQYAGYEEHRGGWGGGGFFGGNGIFTGMILGQMLGGGHGWGGGFGWGAGGHDHPDGGILSGGGGIFGGAGGGNWGGGGGGSFGGGSGGGNW